MNHDSRIRQTYKKSIFIFRRDLRLKDNTGLINAIHSSDFVYCLFILDSNIISSSKSLYTSFSLPIDPKLILKQKQRRIHLLRFLKESLLDLQYQFQKFSLEKEQLNKSKNNVNKSSKLILFVGDPASVIKKIIQTDKEIEAVFVNRDYTPYSIKRDQLIREICKMCNIEFIECSDILINEPEEILNSNNKPFKVFSQYYNKAIEIPIRKENSFDISKYKNNLMSFNNKKLKNLHDLKKLMISKNFFLKFYLNKLLKVILTRQHQYKLEQEKISGISIRIKI
jgi:deoxyribodipyrimidine photo-lyase